MCGLSGGFSIALSASETEDIIALTLLSNLRGDESTGTIFGLENRTKKMRKKKIEGRRSYTSRKAMGDSVAFFKRKDIHNLAWSYNAFLIATHTRLSTKGSISLKNAHPFSVGKVMGMHNGTVPAYSAPVGSDKTDSECIIEDIARIGIKETVKKMGNGAYALVYIDARDDTLNIIRNKQRTLWMMKTTSTIMWASEEDMLTLVANRSKIAYQDPVAFEPGVLYSWKLPYVNALTKTPLITENKVTVYNSDQVRSAIRSAQSGENIPDHTSWDGYLLGENDPEGDNMTPFRPTDSARGYYEYADGHFAFPEKVQEWLDGGCAHCQQPVDTIWDTTFLSQSPTDDRTHICDKCLDGDDTSHGLPLLERPKIAKES